MGDFKRSIRRLKLGLEMLRNEEIFSEREQNLQDIGFVVGFMAFNQSTDELGWNIESLLYGIKQGVKAAEHNGKVKD